MTVVVKRQCKLEFVGYFNCGRGKFLHTTIGETDLSGIRISTIPTML